jgi:hypothetical protein
MEGEPDWLRPVKANDANSVRLLLRDGSFTLSDKWAWPWFEDAYQDFYDEVTKGADGWTGMLALDGSLWTPLGWALLWKAEDVIRLLLDHNAPLNVFCVEEANSETMVTPLVAALTAKCSVDTIVALLSGGADPTVKSFVLEAPLSPQEFADSRRRQELWGNSVQLLLMRRRRCRTALVSLLGCRRYRRTVMQQNDPALIKMLAQIVWAHRGNVAWDAPAWEGFEWEDVE